MATTLRDEPRTALRLAPGAAGARLSAAEFDAVPPEDCEPGYRYELLKGYLIVSPSPSIGERDPNGELEYLIRLFRDTHPQGSSLDATVSEHEVAIGDDRRRADRVIWAGLGRTPDPFHDVPTMTVEFVSRDRRDFLRDYEEKREEYLAIGVREYWIIDRFRRTMTVWSKSPEGAVAETRIDANGIYRSPLLPGFELPLARLLDVADRWTSPDPQAKTNPKTKTNPARPHPRQGRRDHEDG